MSKLIYFTGMSLLKSNLDVPQIQDFLKVQKFSAPNLCIKDRSGVIKTPFNIEILNPLPNFTQTFNLSYKDCVMERMSDLNAMHQRTNKNFRLLYSGGVDSTLILSSFIEYFGVEKTSKILEIYCTPDSIYENPWIWERYVAKNNFKIKSSLNHPNIWNDNMITIQGEGNDQLFGSNGKLQKYLKFNKLTEEFTLEKFTNYLVSTKQEPNDIDARYTTEQYIKIAEKSPIPITTMHLFSWWVTFVLFWDSLMVRILAQANTTQLSPGFLENNLVQFFNTENFQRWTVANSAVNPLFDHNYKTVCKDIILGALDIPEYASKQKQESWPRVHALTKTGCMIDSDLKIYKDPIDFLKFL